MPHILTLKLAGLRAAPLCHIDDEKHLESVQLLSTLRRHGGFEAKLELQLTSQLPRSLCRSIDVSTL